MIRLQNFLLATGCAALLLSCGMAVKNSGSQQTVIALRAELLSPKRVEPIGAEEFRAILASHRGEVLLVNLWATWCKPCVKEFPDIVKLHQKYKDNKFTVITVSLDDPEDLEPKVRPFAAKLMPDFLNYLQKEDDPEKFVSVVDKAWEGVAPTNYLIDREGKLKSKLIGGKSFADFDAAIAPLIGE